MRHRASRRLVVAVWATALLVGSLPVSASVPRPATPGGYSLTFAGAVHGRASGGSVKACAFDPLDLPVLAVQWTGFTVRGVPYDLYLDATGPFKAGEVIPITEGRATDRDVTAPSATLRVATAGRTFDEPLSGSVQLSREGIGVLSAVLGPKVHGKRLRVHGRFVCLQG